MFVNIRLSIFVKHGRFTKYTCNIWAKQSNSNFLEEAVVLATKTCNEVIFTLFRFVNYIGKMYFPSINFHLSIDYLY